MAIVALVQKKHIRGVHEFKWTPLLDTDTGGVAGPLSGAPSLPDKTVQIKGTIGAGFDMDIEGSNDNVNWKVLTDPQGNVLTFTTNDHIVQIQENPLYIRPHVIGGDGTTSMTVIIIARASMPR